MAELTRTVNFIVPAAGLTSSYPVQTTLAAGVIQTLDFRSFELDGFRFAPYGFYAYNPGSNSFSITINEVGLTFNVSPGQTIARPYPGPVEQTVDLSGDGDAVVTFVNYPVFPHN